jgi:uncharacterized membrane protein
VERRVEGLGWFSIGLGLAQLVAPRQVAALIGAEEDERTEQWMRAFGAREFLCGVGLLSKTNVGVWAWARVGGDVVDLAVLGKGLAEEPDNERLWGAAASVLGVTLLDVKTAIDLSRGGKQPWRDGIAVQQGITINRPASEVYEFFRDLENLPRFMSHLESVRVTNGRSHWKATGPLGVRFEWDAEVIEDRPNQLISWRSIKGSEVPNQGTVHFRPGPDDTTELLVDLRYDPPAGAIGSTIAKLFGTEPGQEISADLRRLKQVLETGEVLHSDSSIHRGMHPAQPSELGNVERKSLT